MEAHHPSQTDQEVDNELPSLDTALKNGIPITPAIEEKQYGLACNYMRSKGLTPLGVSDNAKHWMQWHKDGVIPEELVESFPTAEEAQEIVDAISSGKYSKALDILEPKANSLDELIEQEEENIRRKLSQYKKEHPEAVSEHNELLRKKREARKFGFNAESEVAEKIRSTQYQQFMDRVNERIDLLRDGSVRLSVSIKALSGKFID